MRKFEFEKTYEEIEIAGDVYKLDFSDDKIQEFQKSFALFQAEIAELDKLNAETMTDEQALEAIEKQKSAMIKLIEGMFGPDTFEKLYEKSGKSLLNLGRLLGYIGEVLKEKAEAIKPSKKAQYIKTVKQNKARKRA
jgi:hypothetical protein